tara:strand:+ start:386 stop:1102 length:717 start_codon:yes stop_codon:yes gene_type:complete
MGVFAGPNIVEDGLVLALDAANSESYPGSGTSWTDLTGNGFNATLVNSPTHNSDIGFISFNGTNQYANHTVPLISTGNIDFTFEVWFKMRTLPTASYNANGHIWGGENGNDVVLYVNPASSGESKLNLIYDDSRYVTGTGHFTDGTITANTWVQWTCQGRESDDTIAHYLNGKLDRTFNGVRPGQESRNRHADGMIAYDSRYNYYSELDCAVIKEYHRLLTADEVKQNFEALKGRFGL